MKIKTQLKLQKKSCCYVEIIKRHVFSGNKDFDTMVAAINRYRGVIKKLAEHESKHSHINARYARKLDYEGRYNKTPDLRLGHETYGYESLESIKFNLGYISDRFCAEFRLNWLLDVPKNVERLKK